MERWDRKPPTYTMQGLLAETRTTSQLPSRNTEKISGARSARDAVLDLLACILSKEVYTTEMSVYGKWTQLHWYVQLGIKHKRSDRWSAEVSYKKLAAKRYNMADTGAVEIKNDDTSSSGQNEPNLHEIKAMLVDIQISLSSIMLENKHFKKELDELKAFL